MLDSELAVFFVRRSTPLPQAEDAKTWRISSGFIKALQLVHVFPVIMMVAPASESTSRKAGCKAFNLELHAALASNPS